jgi:gamma-glutamylcyclotransferase (GGCT)/AIG2-like uncharacterized protein YtfP
MVNCTLFAYGSNLDEAQMQARCPSARVLGRAQLVGHALVFGGHSGRQGGAVASVVRNDGQAVDGLLYTLSENDLRALDCFEGAPWVYERVTRVVTTSHGVQQRAFVYILSTRRPAPLRPAPRYLAVIVRAYARHRFDPEPLLRAATEGPP